MSIARFESKNYALILAAAAVGLGGTARAAQWDGATGNYSDATHWTPAVPAVTDPAVISAGAVTYDGVTDDGGNFARAADTTVNGTGTLTITGKRFLNARGPGGAAVATPTTFTLGGNGTLNQAGDYFIVGQNGPGTFTQTGGTATINVGRGLQISDAAGARGTLNLNGGTFNATFTSNDGANFQQFLIGRQGADTVSVAGGTGNFTATSDNRRTYVRGGATLAVSSGAMNLSGFQYVSAGRDIGGDGTDGAGTTSTIRVSGGQLNIALSTTSTPRAFIVGHDNGNNGRVVVSGGKLDLTNGPLWLGDGANGTTAAFDQTGGVVDLHDGDIVLGRNLGSVGTWTMDAGTLLANSIGQGANESSTFNYNGGLISLNGDQTGLSRVPYFVAAGGTQFLFDAATNRTTITNGAVPEPTGLALLGLGGLFALRRRTGRNGRRAAR